MSDTVEWAIHCCTLLGALPRGPGPPGRPAGGVPRRPAVVPGQGAPGDDRRRDHRVALRPVRGLPAGPTTRPDHGARGGAGRRRRRHRVPVPRDPPARAGGHRRPGGLPAPVRHRPCDVARGGRAGGPSWPPHRRRPDQRAHRDTSRRRSSCAAPSGSSRSRSRGGTDHEDLPGGRHRRGRHACPPGAGGGRPRRDRRRAHRCRRPTSSGRSAASRCTVDLFDPGAVASAVVGHEVVVNLATSIPPLTKAARGAAGRRTSGCAARPRTTSSTRPSRPDRRGTSRSRSPSPTSTPPTAGSTRTTPSTRWAPSPGARDAEAAAARFATGGGVGVVLRFAQFYAPDSTHTQAFNATTRRPRQPVPRLPRGLHLVRSTRRTPGRRSWPRCGRRAASTTWPTTSRSRAPRPGAIVAEALGVKPPHAVPRVVQAASPSSAKLLMRSLRISNARLHGRDRLDGPPTRRSEGRGRHEHPPEGRAR